MISDLFSVTVLIGILASGIRLATPYLYAAIGETFGQRSGVLNLGVEGQMLLGAFAAFYMTFTTGSLGLGVLTAMLVGAVMGLAMAYVTVNLNAEQGISGIGFFLFGLGMSDLLFQKMLGTVETVKGFSAIYIPGLSDIPGIGEIFFKHNLLVYGAYLLVPIAWFVLNKTTLGLKIRSVGENPDAFWNCWCFPVHCLVECISTKYDKRFGFHCRCFGLLRRLATDWSSGWGTLI
jgi:simple sugar transport system permease protein